MSVVLTHVPVTDATLTSCNITEDDYDVWDATTTFARRDFVISTDTHTVYRSLTDSNLDNDPDIEVAAFSDPLIEDPDPRNWQVIGATNRWRLFDQRPSRVATRTDGITFAVEPAFVIGGVAGFNITAASVKVQVYSGADKIYERTLIMQDESAVVDGLSYYSEPFRPMKEFAFDDLPILGSPKIVVTLAGTGAVSAGQIVIGRRIDFGITMRDGTGSSGLDFSYVNVNEYGDLETVRRPATRLFDINLFVERKKLFSLIRTLDRLRGGTAAVWIGASDGNISAIGYGFYRGYRQVYVGADHAQIALEIQGIT